MQAAIRRTAVPTMLGAALLLGGCVLGTRNPTLTYPPASDSRHAPVAQAAEKSSPRNIQIFLQPLADERSDKGTVGTTRNAFGMRMADVVPKNDVSEWVTQAMKTELENSGYTVVEGKPQAGASSTSIAVSGEILNVFCDMYMSYTGQVSLVVRLKRGDAELLNKHYAGEGSAGLAVAATSESYARSLALALSSALQKFVADLNRSLAAE
ncbi:YajG family lipoprotein [Trinickia sp.]|uniref:YajG family lipoprotein n=1 Tax=Trinickia sp. TaxID=2571163 RepID=UPI003F81E26A